MFNSLSSHIRRNVVGYLALFIALGGTSYAATGGNFILGKSNTAGAPTQLSSPTTNSAGAFKVTSTASSGGRAIQGTSAHGQGVYGHSGSNAGVVGDSSTFDGVFGVSNDSDSAGVSGHGDGGGYGLWGSGGSVLFHTAAIHGQSSAGNAVEGISGRDVASGVYGQNNSTGYGVAGRANNGTAVLGDSSNGWAFNASGNVTQSRGKGGFVKAAAYVDPGNASDPIQQCFNSQLSPSQATAGNCGIAYTHVTTGGYDLNFGFRVDDRFPLGMSANSPYVVEAMPIGASPTNTLRVSTFNPVSNNSANGDFYIFVY